MTASPGELLVMLYDGLLQRVRSASKRMKENDPGGAGELLGRAQDILHELINMLDRDKVPELVDSLSSLYEYCAHLLLAAVSEQNSAKLDEVYGLLRPLRDAWHKANQQLREEASMAAVAG
jgi:flagellar protein FliS